ncbi:MAG: Crp/Fnr family transcriptional regulator, partial [Actinomycetota bacterium]
MDVATFLSRYPPFDALVPQALDQVAKDVEIEHFPAGAVILEQSGEPARFLYVIRKGAVELLTEGRLYDLLSDGDVFGLFSLLDGEGPTSTVRAHEDTLCYLIGADVADEVLGTSAGRTFVLGAMRERLAAGHEAVEPPGVPYRPVGGLLRRPAVVADPGMTVA